MINSKAADLTRALKGKKQIEFFNLELTNWLKAAEDDEGSSAGGLSERRARSLLVASDFINEAQLQDFSNLLNTEAGPRVAIYDLLTETRLAEVEGIWTLVAVSEAKASAEEKETAGKTWLAMLIGAFAWKSGYPTYQFDPAAPPAPESPAGQVLRRTAQFIRRQIQKSATERDKLNRTLSQPPSVVPSLDELSPGGTEIAPAPPHYRSPVPVGYPEVSSETVHIGEQDISDVPTVEVGDPLVISSDELPSTSENAGEPTRLPPIRIDSGQLEEETAHPPSPLPAAAVVMPSSTEQTRPSLSMSIRQMFSQENMTSAKLRVVVQEYPDGPGLYGIQVRVMSKGIKSYVAGTTNREGQFLCELPVRMQSGLTYDVQVTWPRDVGGDVERKSITLNADRTIFTLPFYVQINPPAA